MIDILSKKECLFLKELAVLLTKYDTYMKGDGSIGVFLYVIPDMAEQKNDELETTPIHFDTSFDENEIMSLLEENSERIAIIEQNKKDKVYDWNQI